MCRFEQFFLVEPAGERTGAASLPRAVSHTNAYKRFRQNRNFFVSGAF
jgi:hypothetical protein